MYLNLFNFTVVSVFLLFFFFSFLFVSNSNQRPQQWPFASGTVFGMP